MSVDIYGRTYKGAQYRELIEHATKLIPKRSQEKAKKPDPFVGHRAARQAHGPRRLEHRSEREGAREAAAGAAAVEDGVD